MRLQRCPCGAFPFSVFSGNPALAAFRFRLSPRHSSLRTNQLFSVLPLYALCVFLRVFPFVFFIQKSHSLRPCAYNRFPPAPVESSSCAKRPFPAFPSARLQRCPCAFSVQRFFQKSRALQPFSSAFRRSVCHPEPAFPALPCTPRAFFFRVFLSKPHVCPALLSAARPRLPPSHSRKPAPLPAPRLYALFVFLLTKTLSASSFAISFQQSPFPSTLPLSKPHSFQRPSRLVSRSFPSKRSRFPARPSPLCVHRAPSRFI